MWTLATLVAGAEGSGCDEISALKCGPPSWTEERCQFRIRTYLRMRARYVCMHGCMYACMHGCMDAWMHECTFDARVPACMHAMYAMYAI